MVRKLLFFIISIFLCVLISSDAFAGDTFICAPDSVIFWKKKAVECERSIFEGCTPEETNAFLFAKAEAYRKAGMDNDAIETLRRVRVYLLDDVERSELDFVMSTAVQEEKAPCHLTFANVSLSASSVAWIVLNACSGLYLTGFLGGGIVLYSLWWPEYLLSQ